MAELLHLKCFLERRVGLQPQVHTQAELSRPAAAHSPVVPSGVGYVAEEKGKVGTYRLLDPGP